MTRSSYQRIYSCTFVLIVMSQNWIDRLLLLNENWNVSIHNSLLAYASVNIMLTRRSWDIKILIQNTSQVIPDQAIIWFILVVQ